jgi:hypothetical protein
MMGLSATKKKKAYCPRNRKDKPMAKKNLFLLCAIILIFNLTACSAIQLPWASASTSSTQTSSLANFSGQPVKNKLAVGMLQLEGSDLAITPAQAKELLPLWKAVKSLSKDSNTTSDEMAALYVQIEGVLTANQVKAIENLDMSTGDLTALVQKYESQTSVSSSSPSTTTSQSAQSAQGGPVGGPGGDIQGITMQDPGGLGGIVGGAPSATQSSTSKTSPSGASSPLNQASLNLLLADPVISLLNTRLASQGS